MNRLQRTRRPLAFSLVLLAVTDCAVVTPPDPVIVTSEPSAGTDVGIEYVAVRGGRFLMGSPPEETDRDEAEGPQHEVSISSFELGKYEVTVRQYAEFLRTHPDIPTPIGWEPKAPPEEPAQAVSWREAALFARWVGGRLPSEAEWEYAARAGTTQSRYGDLDAIAWYDGNSGEALHDVGSLEPNALGLYDMLGSVYEWTADWYAPYDAAAQVDPTGPSIGGRRVVRGGSFADGSQYCRAAYRSIDDPGLRSGDYGIRVARSVPAN